MLAIFERSALARVLGLVVVVVVATVAPPTSGATDFSAQRRGGGIPTPEPRSATQADAASDALKYGVTRAYQMYAPGAGAAPVNEMLGVYRKIDPDGKMSESERNLTAIGIVYRYKMAMGDPEGAKRAAFQMLQHYRTAAAQYAAIGAAAIKEGAQTGDPRVIDASLKAIIKSYANISDGKDMKLWRSDDGRIGYSMTNAEGKQIEGGIASPQQILGSTLKIAQGQVEPYILAAAGEQHLQRTKGAKGGPAVDPITGQPKPTDETETGKVPKPKDRKELMEQVSGHVDDYVKRYKESEEFKKTGKEITPAEITRMKDVPYHIARNNDKTNSEALRLASTFITAQEPTKPGEVPAFKVSQDPETKQVTVRYKNGEVLDMNARDFAGILEARNQAMKERAAAAVEDAKISPARAVSTFECPHLDLQG